MRKLLLLLLLASFIAGCKRGPGEGQSSPPKGELKHLPSEQQNIKWAKVYGGAGNDIAFSIQQTTDGGYIVVGYTESFGAGGKDVWILKLDQNGNVQWQRTYGGVDDDLTISIQQTADGGYIMAGSTASSDEAGAWVLKLDQNGNVVWQRGYAGIASFSIRQTTDGGYIVAGLGYSSITSSFGLSVLKLDQNGNVVWQKIYGVDGLDIHLTFSIQQTTDGGYIVAGFPESMDAGLILKLDRNGNVEWQRGYAGGAIISIRQTTDGGYIGAGAVKSPSTNSLDIWVLKLDQNGNVVWQKTYGGQKYDAAGSIQQTSDGGYIVAGTTESFGAGGEDVWVLKLDQNGNVVWQNTYGGKRNDGAFSIQQTTDGGYIVVGATESFGAGGENFLVLKLDQNGNVSKCKEQGKSDAKLINITITPTTSTAVATVGGNFTSEDIDIIPADINLISTNTNALVEQICFDYHYSLTVNKAGTGTGTVKSDPSGIDCGGDCAWVYLSDTTVTLTATPDTDTIVFAGWSGDCSSCKKKTKCQVKMDAVKTCTATFNQKSPGGCSMGVGTSPINAFAYLLLPMLVALRRFMRR